MKSPFGRKAVPASTITELKARGTSAGIAWNAKKFPWVVLTSLCSECARGGAYTELSGKGPNYTLDQGAIGGATGANIFASAGLSTVVNVLGTQRPAPTIESVEVKKQGELGTTRKVIVNIKAYTDLQLIGLQKCFFIPQMGVRVQWGWSHSTATAISGNPPPITTITNRKLSDADAICQMKKLEKANPNYSGLQGIVANFSYNLTTENYWDCSIEIIAATEALSGAKVNTYNCGCKRESEVEDESGSKQKVVRVESDIIAHLRDLQDKFPEGYAAYNSTLSGYGRRVSIAQYYFKQTKQRNESGQISRSWGQAIQDFFTWSAESYEAFISWGALEALINYLVMDLGKDGGGSSKKWLGRISSSDVELSYHPAVASGDPYVCLVPGGQFQDTIATYKQGDNPPSAISGNKVLLGNIMINVIFLIGELRAVETGEGSLISFLNTILSRISESCGGLWALEAVSTTESCDSTKDAPTITVIDIKPYEAAAAFSIPSSPNNSCVRDMKLDMKMTDAMKTQALYSGGPIAKTKSPSGGNCDGDAFRAFNAAGTKAYNLAKDQRTSDVASSDCGTSNTGALQKTADTSYDALFKKLADNGPKSSIISACKSVLIEAYSLTAGGFSGWRGTSGPSSNSGGRRDHCTGVPLPFEFSFTVDGIGGFEFGQMVTSDRIPDEIKANFEWQVTSVEHSITSQDWTTTVNTICRFKNN